MERHRLLLSRQFDTHNHNYGGLSLDGINHSVECISESKIAVIQNPQVVDNPTPICQSSDLHHYFDEMIEVWALDYYHECSTSVGHR